jgi:hypothetical protein
LFLLCEPIRSQNPLPDPIYSLEHSADQWLGTYLTHYQADHFNQSFTSQNEILKSDSLYQKMYAGSQHVYLLAALCDFYFPLFKKSIRQHHLPEDLQYLPAILSGCNPQFQFSGRAGLWALNVEDAQRIGLRVDDLVDERRGGDFTTEAWCKELGARFSQLDLPTLLSKMYGQEHGLRLAHHIEMLKTIFSEIHNQNYLTICMDAFALTAPIRFDQDCSLLALGALTRTDTTLIRQLNPIFVGSHFPANEKRTTLILPIQLVPLLEQRRRYCTSYSAPIRFIHRRVNHPRKLHQLCEKYWVSEEEIMFYNGMVIQNLWSTEPSSSEICKAHKKIRIPIFKEQ